MVEFVKVEMLEMVREVLIVVVIMEKVLYCTWGRKGKEGQGRA